jgi:hypothetical protein
MGREYGEFFLPILAFQVDSLLNVLKMFFKKIWIFFFVLN